MRMYFIKGVLFHIRLYEYWVVIYNFDIVEKFDRYF